MTTKAEIRTVASIMAIVRNSARLCENVAPV
jgi:hypothetical protein